MGKISDIHEEYKRAERRRQSVGEFSKELRKKPRDLLNQLKQAGLQKTSETDLITAADKEALLHFLQKTHELPDGHRKKAIPFESEGGKLIREVMEKKGGSEWACLEYFATCIVSDLEIEPKLQAVVNFILTKSVIFDSLPIKKFGRPKLQKSINLGKTISQEYWDKRDSGISYDEAVGQLAAKFHKGERQIMRIVEKNKQFIGATIDQRARQRWLNEMMSHPLSLEAHSRLEMLYSKGKPLPEISGADCIVYLDEKIVEAVLSKDLTDINSSIFLASD